MTRNTALALLILLCLLGSSHCRAEDLSLPLHWTVNTGTLLETAPTIADLDGKGQNDILLAGREEMIALNGDGSPRWRWRTAARYMTYPAVLDRKGQTALIYAADNGGLMSCLNSSGKVVWQAHLKTGSSWSASAICDLHHNGAYQVIQTDESGTVWAFDALSGKVVWQAHVTGSPVSPAVGDVDGDGNAEVVVATNAGKLALISASGKVQWEQTISSKSDTWGTSAPILFRASDGHMRIAVGSSDGRVNCFNATGHRLWSHTTHGYVASTLSVGDMDHDGRTHLFAITGKGVIYRYDEDGRELWNIDMQGRTIAAGALIDLQNDGHLNYVVSTQSGHLMVFNNHAEVVYEHQFSNRTINMTPAFGGLTQHSGRLEMVIAGGESGKVFCFETPALASQPPSEHPWISYRGNSRKTGAWDGLTGLSLPLTYSTPRKVEVTRTSQARMSPKGVVWSDLVAGDPIVFAIDAPAATHFPLRAYVQCVRPDHSCQAALTPVYGPHGELPLTLELVEPGPCAFQWSLHDAGGRWLASGRQSAFLNPVANARALIQRALHSLRATANHAEPSLPLTARALTRESVLLEHAAGAGPTITVTRQARHALAIARAAGSAVQFGRRTSLITFQTTLWDSGVAQQTPAEVRNPIVISRRVIPGQHEPISLKLFNITDHELLVRVVIDPVTGGPSLAPFRSVAVPTSQGGTAWDPLVELDETSTISIPSLETREIWLDARFTEVKPGDYVKKVHFQALNGAGVLDGPANSQDVPAPETAVELRWRVLPFDMAPEGSFRMCCWANYGPGEIADLLDHGNNVFTVPHGDPVYDLQGQLTSVDYTRLDALLTALHGHDTVLLLQGKPVLKPAEESPQYTVDLKTYLDSLIVHLAQRGFDTDHFALYPYDEPGGNGWQTVNALVAFGQQVKAACPHIKIYMDGGAELPMVQKLAPYIDIWCPGIGEPADSSPEMTAIRNTGKTLWTYECGYGYTTAMAANLKDTNIVAEYRVSALFALRWGATGIGFWSYNIGPNPWQRVAIDYPIVYPGKPKPVTSRRWEAVRQSIQDARILIALRQREADITDPTIKRRIEALFSQALPALLDRSHQEVVAGIGRAALSQSQNDATIAAFRTEMLDCVENLTRMNTATRTSWVH
jgi:outer membrane protein assembly factor BamB